jgi:branched-chain amino acid transport system ATP-binding protein
MLELQGLSLNYGHFRALNEITLSAQPGELVVLLGANGAGKSSLFLTVSGIHKPATGRILLSGTDVTGQRPAALVARGLVHCPEGRKLFAGMTVRQNLMLGGYMHRRDKAGSLAALEEIFNMFPILREKAGDPAGSLSGGQQQMVAIGRALMGRPQVLLLDEPSLGLAPLVIKQVFDTIQKVNQSGVTVLLAEQNAYQALSIAHRGYVLERGHIVLEGLREELMNNAQVRRAYIGG